MAGKPPGFTAVDVLIYIQQLWKDGYRDFPNLKGMTPAQVLARLPEEDERFHQGGEGLREVLRKVRSTKRW